LDCAARPSRFASAQLGFVGYLVLTRFELSSVFSGGQALAVPSISTDSSFRVQIVAEKTFWVFLDLFLPPHCASCEQAGERLCARCRAGIEYLPQTICERCGYPQDNNTPTTGECDQCGRIPFLGNGLRSVAFHGGSLRHALHTLKYRRNVPLSETLAQLMNEHWPIALPADAVLMPVPLSLERRQERGFNQAELLTRQLAWQRRMPLLPQAIKRARHTPSQVGLSRAQRLENVSEAFVADPSLVKGLTVIVVDDVCTTGATLGACAQALMQAGAAQVWAYTLARARRDDADKLH
jgi:ComF family protein